MLLKILYLILAGEVHVTRGSDDFDFRSENLEGKVKAHLIVTCACASVGHIVSAYLLCILDDGDSLEYTFRANRYGIGTVTKNVTEYHVLYALFVVLLSDVKCGMGLGSESKRTLLYRLELLGREAAGVGNGGVHLVSAILAKILNRK